MRILYTLILFFYSQATFAQTAISYNQTYTYKKSDGFLSENYSYLYQASNGKIYCAGYASNTLNIVGNNYSKQLAFTGGINVTSLNEVDSNTVFFFTTTNIYIVKADTIANTIPFINSAQVIKITATNFLFINATANNTEIYKFNGNSLSLLTTISTASVNKQFYYNYKNDTLCFYVDSLITILHLADTKNSKIFTSKANRVAAVIANTFIKYNNNNNLYSLKDGNIIKIPNHFFNHYTQVNELLNLSNTLSTNYLQKSSAAEYTILDTGLVNPKAFFSSNDIVFSAQKSSNSSYLVGAGTMPFRVFDYIKKYPKLYNNVDASNIFSVLQHTNGSIWAGSYKTDLTIVNGYKQKQVPIKDVQFMNGGISYNNKMYLIGETSSKGLVLVNEDGSYKKLTSGVTGFYTYISKNKKDFYFATADYHGIYKKKMTDVDDISKHWQMLDSSNGIKLQNVLSIVEDTMGRIWCGHPSRGIAVYNPNTNITKTYLIKQKESTFGFMSSIIDKYGTVWFGSVKGKNLWYYNDYSKPATAASCVQVKHPLLETNKIFSAMTIYKNWLVMAAQDKILLLDLDAFHNEHKTVVKYLTSQETNFTASTEQNTMLTSFTDSTIWFSSTDMLYQWDIKKWLALPKYKVKSNVYLNSSNTQIELDTLHTIYTEPTFTSFDINLQYLSPDGLPRYTSAAFVKDGDTLKMPEPNLQSAFNMKNLSASSYTFYVNIFEQDGTTSHYEYKIIIKKFLWQQWWFWLGIALLCTGIITYLLHLKKKKQLAEQVAKTNKAELETVKAEQAKKIANLQLVTLSSQFRPHFILNALNTIGAQMDDKPEAESVLSRLGESINLIFSHAQQQKIVHSFANEW